MDACEKVRYAETKRKKRKKNLPFELIPLLVVGDALMHCIDNKAANVKTAAMVPFHGNIAVCLFGRGIFDSNQNKFTSLDVVYVYVCMCLFKVRVHFVFSFCMYKSSRKTSCFDLLFAFFIYRYVYL